MGTRVARFLSAALGSFLLCVAAVNPGETVYRCRFDHVARTTCCCSPGERAGMASVRCCDIETYKLTPQVPPAAPDGGMRSAVTAILLPPPLALLPPRPVATAPVDRRPRDGPTIVVLSHSFRI